MFKVYILKNREGRLAVFLFTLVFMCLSALSISGCGKKEEERHEDNAAADADIYTLEVIKDRKKKDLHFLTSENSPLKQLDREYFIQLDYYPPSREFAFATVLERLPQPREINMATSKNKPRGMLLIGYFPFTYKGNQCKLEVYQPKDTTDDKYWFIPFTDETNGTETYTGGRYLDIDDTSSDSTFLDFNYAYNPYCSYNEKYDCPIPPEGNRLPLAIRAGEKAFKKGR